VTSAQADRPFEYVAPPHACVRARVGDVLKRLEAFQGGAPWRRLMESGDILVEDALALIRHGFNLPRHRVEKRMTHNGGTLSTYHGLAAEQLVWLMEDFCRRGLGLKLEVRLSLASVA
jgi:hypothetical protein